MCHFCKVANLYCSQCQECIIFCIFLHKSPGMKALRTRQAPLINSTMVHTTQMQQESCTTWSAWSRSPPCISSCRVAGGNADEMHDNELYLTAILWSHAGFSCRCLGLTVQTDSFTQWQLPGRLEWRARLTSKSSSRSSSTSRNFCRTWTVGSAVDKLDSFKANNQILTWRTWRTVALFLL